MLRDTRIVRQDHHGGVTQCLTLSSYLTYLIVGVFSFTGYGVKGFLMEK